MRDSKLQELKRKRKEKKDAERARKETLEIAKRGISFYEKKSKES